MYSGYMYCMVDIIFQFYVFINFSMAGTSHFRDSMILYMCYIHMQSVRMIYLRI